MARPLRMDFPDSFYHVLSRGNERRDIYRTKRDYEQFLDLLERMVERFGIEVHAYALLPNHYHLLLRTREGNLSRAVQWLGVSYSIWFNLKHQRVGHLFQGRFKSFIVENERYFSSLCTYIHGNPLRAGLAENLADYRWSSYPFYAGSRKSCPWLKTEVILGFFGGSRRKFVREQRLALEKGADLLTDLRHGLYFGSAAFAEKCLERAEKEKDREKPQYGALHKERDIRTLARKILEVLGAGDPGSILDSRNTRSPIRDSAICILYDLGFYRNADIGKLFIIGYTAVTEAAKRGRRHLESDPALRKKAEHVLD
jgi:REP element-mobilizing transposase RayT